MAKMERKMNLKCHFSGNSYADSQDTLALGWGTTQAIFIPGVGSIRFWKYCILSIVILTIFCLRIPNLHSLLFIASTWLLHLDFIQNPVSRHLRLCWRRDSFLWATQNVVLLWDAGAKKGRELGKPSVCKNHCEISKHFNITLTITNIVCRPRQSTGGRITENMICAANEEEGSDTCQVGLRKMQT